MQTRGGVLSELLVEHVKPGHVQRIQSTQHHRFYCRLALYCRAMRCDPPETLLRASAVRCRTPPGVHDLVLRLNHRFGPLGRCRFFNALHIRGECRALLVFFL